MKNPVNLAVQMWEILGPTFRETMAEHGITDHKQKAQLWAAFLAAACGGMIGDIGKPDAITVLEGVLGATKETPYLHVVGAVDKRNQGT